MNRTAFQIYGTKKGGIFTSTWNTNLTEVSTIQLATTATGANWSGTSYTLGYTHTSGIGNTASLTSAIPAVIGLNYILVATITNRTVGSVTINYGGTSNAGITASTTLNLFASTVGQLTIIPTSDFDGKIAISLKNSSSPSNQLKLPLVSTGTYNFWVDWGDGTYDNITSWNQAQRIHTYASPGTYKVRISGIINDFTFFPQQGDRKKLISITSWGKVKIGYRAFESCSNMTLNNVDDILDLSLITSMAFMFYECTALTTIGRINEWNTSNMTSMYNTFLNCTNFNSSLSSWNTTNVTAMDNMFYGCTNFNQNLGNWNVANCLSFSGIFQSCSNFNNGGSSGINNWLINTTSNVDMTRMFNSAGKFNLPLDLWNVTKVTSMSQMFQYCTIFNQSLNNWERTTIGNTSTLANVINMSNMFFAATAFNNGYASGVANQLTWNTSACTSMSGTFQGATAFNSNLGNGTTPWDVSKVTAFTNMFTNAIKFNNGDNAADINNWSINIISSINMGNMFNGASVFNRNINNWDTSKVTTMSSMFQSALIFNQPIDSWNMSSVTNTTYMFYNAPLFNQSLSNWERVGSSLAKVTSFASMFLNASNFNNGLSSGVNGILPWVTTELLSTSGMFNSAIKFNCDVSTFVMNKVTDMTGMFNTATVFNNGGSPNINNWTLNTTSSVIMGSIFNAAAAFNQPIGNWNMSKVSTTNNMFVGANLFNQSLSNWERTTPDVSSLSSVTNMSNMFNSTPAFQQNIGNWNISNVAAFTNFMLGKTPATFPSTYLDNIYNGWSIRSVKPNISISFGTAKYSQAGKPGKDILIGSPNNWTIADGLLTVSGTSNNGGLIRVTTSAVHGFITGDIVYIYGVGGTTNANGTWTVTVISTTIIQLQGSTYNSAWTSGGNVILG